ncbi:hypothetical protein AHAS_Ahas20G0177600 [Arachis hypogaea]
MLEKGDHRGSFQRNQSKHFAPTAQNFKRGGYIPLIPQGQNAHKRGNNNNKNKEGLGVCYACGRAGHLSWNYPDKKRYDAGRAQHPRRVFTTSAVSTKGFDTLIQGNCEIGGKTLNALFDSGATHSFIAFEKASEL